MSAFLGPIHFWLFKKIQFQDQLCRDILAGMRDQEEAARIGAQMDKTFGRLPEGELEELIDTGNIHGWLQSQIGVVERRFAYLVTEAKRSKASDMEELRSLAKKAGEAARPVEKGSSCRDAFSAIDALLLNGMPCDRVNVVTKDEDGRFSWELASDIHGPFWMEVGGDPADYYAIREALFDGMLADTGLHIDVSGMDYAIFA